MSDTASEQPAAAGTPRAGTGAQSRAALYIQVKSEMQAYFSDAGEQPPPEQEFARMILDEVQDRMAASGTAGSTHAGTNGTTNVTVNAPPNNAQKVSMLVTACGKYSDETSGAVHVFLDRFTTAYRTVVGDSPYGADWATCSSFLAVVLDGRAYQELQTAAPMSWPAAREALLKRFGKSAEQCLLELLNLKQGTRQLMEYLDAVRDLAAQGRVSDAVVVTALSQSLRREFADPLIARVSQEVAAGRSLTLRAAIQYLRELGARTTARVQHINDQSSAAAANRSAAQNLQAPNRTSNQRKPITCHKCGQEGHIAANCPLNRAAPSRAAAVSRPAAVAAFADVPSLSHYQQRDLPPAPPLPSIQEQDESAATLFTNLVATVNEGVAEQATASVAELDPATVDLVKLCTCGAGLVQDQHLYTADEDPVQVAVDQVLQNYTAVADAGLQIGHSYIPKPSRRPLTAEEMVQRVRVKMTLMHYTQFDDNVRTCALHTLINQQQARRLPVVVPDGADVIHVPRNDYADVTRVAEIIAKHVQSRDRKHDATAQTGGDAGKRARDEATQAAATSAKRTRAQLLAQLVAAGQPTTNTSPPTAATLRRATSPPLQAAVVHPTRDTGGGGGGLGPPRASTVLPGDVEDFTSLPYEVKTHQDSHYQVQTLLENKRCIALYDTGAHTTLISSALVKALGLKLHPISTGASAGSCKGLEGIPKPFAGELRDVRLTLHPLFELVIPRIPVTDSGQLLFLLGNDIFRDHTSFSFVSLEAEPGGTGSAFLRLRDKLRHLLVEVPCRRSPDSTAVNPTKYLRKPV